MTSRSSSKRLRVAWKLSIETGTVAIENVNPTGLIVADEISPDLMAHLRYPQDIFKVQRQIFAKYHVTDPVGYFSGQDFWNVPNDPTKPTASSAQPPYYLQVQMPGQNKPSFSLTNMLMPELARQSAISSSGNAHDIATTSGSSDVSSIAFIGLPWPRNMTGMRADFFSVENAADDSGAASDGVVMMVDARRVGSADAAATPPAQCRFSDGGWLRNSSPTPHG